MKNYDPRMHSAEHILNQTMDRMYQCGRCFNAHIERKKSKCDYHFTKGLTADEIEAIQSRVNQVIESDLPVSEQFISKSKAMSRFNTEKLPDDVGDRHQVVVDHVRQVVGREAVRLDEHLIVHLGGVELDRAAQRVAHQERALGGHGEPDDVRLARRAPACGVGRVDPAAVHRRRREGLAQVPAEGAAGRVPGRRRARRGLRSRDLGLGHRDHLLHEVVFVLAHRPGLPDHVEHLGILTEVPDPVRELRPSAVRRAFTGPPPPCPGKNWKNTDTCGCTRRSHRRGTTRPQGWTGLPTRPLLRPMVSRQSGGAVRRPPHNVGGVSGVLLRKTFGHTCQPERCARVSRRLA